MKTDGLNKELVPVIFKIINDTEHTLSMMTGTKVELTMKATGEVMSRDDAMMYSVQKLICREFGISWSKIISASRKNEIMEARMAYYLLGKRLLNKSSTVIGRELNRDHSSVIQGRKRLRGLVESGDAIKNKIEKIEKKFYEDFYQI